MEETAGAAVVREEPALKIIDRYITLSYIRILGLCLSSFSAVYLTIDFLDKGARFARAQASVHHIALFFLFKIPEIVVQIMPLGVLLATLLTLGMLSRTGEIVAMRSCGIGLGRISAPLLVTAGVISVISLFLGEVVVPRTAAKMKYVEDIQINRKSINTFFRQNNIWYREGSYVLQAKLFDPVRQTLRGVTLWRTTPEMKPLERIDAAEGYPSRDEWRLRDVLVHDFTGAAASSQAHAELPIHLGLKVADLKIVGKYAENMGFFDLMRYSRKLERGGYDPTRYQTLMHSRLSLPFASVIMACLGVPFAIRSGRSGGVAIGLGISLGIGFSFHMINSLLISFGQQGALPPVVAAWSANVIFAAVAVWLTLTVHR